jgi:hypothetical protein
MSWRCKANAKYLSLLNLLQITLFARGFGVCVGCGGGWGGGEGRVKPCERECI